MSHHELDNHLDLLFIVTGLTLGGAEIQVTELAVAHARSGTRVGVMCMVSNGTTLRTRLASEGIEVMDLGMRRGFPSVPALVRAATIIRRRNPRIVHSHMFHSNLLARVLRLISPIPVLVCTAHNSNEGGLMRMLAYRATSRLGSVLTNVTEAAARELERRGAAQMGSIVPVWNGIDVERYRKDDNRRAQTRQALSISGVEFVFLAVGRLTRQKDYPTMLNALRLVANVESSVRLLIVGQGELAAELARLCSSLGLESHVQCLGERNDVEHLMNAADAFVISSAYEGFGLVVAEAMASELPVIATRCNGPEEVLGGTGTLVPIERPDVLAEAMVRLMKSDPEQRAWEGKRARMRALEHFSIAAAVGSWRSLYASLGVKL